MAEQNSENKIHIDTDEIVKKKENYNNQSPRIVSSDTSSEGSRGQEEDDEGDYKIFNDPIHGHIQLDFILIRIIDTPQFQRQRYIKQLGCVYGVFPGASHNRFEHALGVCHLAGELVQRIMDLQRNVVRGPEPIVTKEEALCVKIAALCYNLGYGPYSHVFNQMVERRVESWNVEKVSFVMFQHLVAENNLERDLILKGIDEEKMKFIEAIMNPNVDIPERMKDKAFLRDIVRNPRTNIDAVTQDSIARDSYLLNLPCNFDQKRLVKFVRLNKKTDNEDYVLCYREKEAPDMYAMLLSHLSLQTRAYKHKTVQLMEKMLEQALSEADGVMRFIETACGLLSDDEGERTEAARRYTRLTDYVTDKIMESTDESLGKAREILQDMQKRRLKKLIGTVQTDLNASSEGLELKLKDLQRMAEEQIDPEACTILLVEYWFGTKECENPVEKIHFYYKNNRTVPVHIKREQVSKILPMMFSEFLLRVYHKQCNDGSYQTVARTFQGLIQEHHDQLHWTPSPAPPVEAGPSDATPSPVPEPPGPPPMEAGPSDATPSPVPEPPPMEAGPSDATPSPVPEPPPMEAGPSDATLSPEPLPPAGPSDGL